MYSTVNKKKFHVRNTKKIPNSVRPTTDLGEHNVVSPIHTDLIDLCRTGLDKVSGVDRLTVPLVVTLVER